MELSIVDLILALIGGGFVVYWKLSHDRKKRLSQQKAKTEQQIKDLDAQAEKAKEEKEDEIKNTPAPDVVDSVDESYGSDINGVIEHGVSAVADLFLRTAMERSSERSPIDSTRDGPGSGEGSGDSPGRENRSVGNAD